MSNFMEIIHDFKTSKNNTILLFVYITYFMNFATKLYSFHEEIARKLNIFVYFAKPYHSWERGANENSNGLIRQYFPKGTDFRDITNEQVMRVQNILNSRPRKRLGYMTPKEKYKLLTNNEFDTVALSV